MTAVRLGSLALAVLAIVALAMVAASVETVSTEPTVTTGEPTEESTPPPQGPGGGPGTPEGTQSASRAPDTEVTTTAAASSNGGPPRWQVAAGLTLVVLGGVVLLYELTHGEETDSDVTDDDPVPASTAPAADSVLLTADVPPENDVYRAWSALRSHVESTDNALGPPTDEPVTPADVRQKAIESGLPRRPVTALTELFCVVRYGDAAATPERERQARAAAVTLSLDSPDGGEAS